MLFRTPRQLLTRYETVHRTSATTGEPTVTITPRPSGSIAGPSNSSARAASLLLQYRQVRSLSRQLCEPLCAEDCVIQSMPDVSPVRWHLAHTTWFFETFLLKVADANYQPHHPAFEVLFNSYYNTVGEQFPRHRRGLISRPTVAEIWQYRDTIDACVENWIATGHTDNASNGDASSFDSLLDVLETGLHHEQQHQELMLTDIKHVFSCNPLLPAYRTLSTSASNGSYDTRSNSANAGASDTSVSLNWVDFPGGLLETGLAPEPGVFSFDNESPRHKQYVEPYSLADRLSTAGEYLAFIEDGGYQRSEYWLSAGWDTVQREGWQAPFYWRNTGGGWRHFTLHGEEPVNLNQPVCHLSYFEADAFARWSGARLPTEAQWEAAAITGSAQAGSFVESGRYHPAACRKENVKPSAGSLHQMYGELWQWTASPYEPYPGYAPPAGALGEYNGKFMCNQYVLRGGSCATSRTHIRPTYRNFFPPPARWQFSGVRLAR